MKKDNTKVFVIVNSYWLGDILLVNPMIQNIKRLYPDSVVVMLTDEKLYDAAKYQQGVDDVIIWDRKNKHKSLINTLKFVFNFPYKNIYAMFPIYGMDRPVLLSKFFNPKYILSYKKEHFTDILLKSKYKLVHEDLKVQMWHINLLKGITKSELQDCKMVYNPTPFDFPIKNYICICPISSRKEKDMPYNTIVDIIKSAQKKVVLLGSGSVIGELSAKLKSENLPNLIDYSNKTTINQAGWILKNSDQVISVDTGLLHLSLAVGAKIIGLFYTDNTKTFMPDKNIYENCKILEDKSPENIIKNIQS